MFLVFLTVTICFLAIDCNASVISISEEKKLFSYLYHRNVDMDKWIPRARKALCKIRNRYDLIIEREAKKRGLDPDDVTAIIIMESLGKKWAVSRKGACGLMQLMPGTARDMGVRNIFDPDQNIMGGTKYFKKLLDEFGNFDTALAAYNLGPERTKNYLELGFNPSKFFFVKIIKMVKKDLILRK